MLRQCFASYLNDYSLNLLKWSTTEPNPAWTSIIESLSDLILQIINIIKIYQLFIFISYDVCVMLEADCFCRWYDVWILFEYNLFVWWLNFSADHFFLVFVVYVYWHITLMPHIETDKQMDLSRLWHCIKLIIIIND